jgi:hypothetical protein
MACPYFYPTARFETSTWAVPPRLPLGDPYSGECRASEAVFQPEEKLARETCNPGYGASACERFPKSAEADAVRFHVAADQGELIRIQYVFEKECWPLEHGVLEYSGAAHDVSGESKSEILRKQAAAFLESYLRRKI